MGTMSRRIDVCRDFLRGSCRYGSRCKFLHHIPQQPQSSPFGFGTKSETQKQPSLNRSGNYYAPLSNVTSPQKQLQGPAHLQSQEHRCSNCEDCKKQLEEGLRNEKPLYWTLTCYAHWKYLPNDVTGDVSFEELRAFSYDAAKQGVPFGTVIQNERSLFNAKNAEFQRHLKSPYTGPSPANTSFVGGTPQTSTPGFSHFTSRPQTQFFESRRNVENTVGTASSTFSFGIGAPTQPNMLFQSPPATGVPGFSFGIQTGGLSGANPIIQSSIFGGGSGSFNKSMVEIGKGSSLPNKDDYGGTSFLGDMKEDIMMNNSFSIQSMPSSVETMNIELPVHGALSKETANLFPPVQIPSPILQNKDVWFKESWTLGEIPEDEPPLYAR